MTACRRATASCSLGWISAPESLPTRHGWPLNGHAHATNGRITGWSSFIAPFDRAAMTGGYDHTADELGKLAATLGARLPVTDPTLTETMAP